MSADPRTQDLLAALDDHATADAREAWSRRRIIALLRWLPRPFDEDADPIHVTGSGIVLATDGRVVLHRHKRLGIWLQPGGHVDAGETPAEAALRETVEETGIGVAHPPAGPRLIHVDVHEGGRGHVHLDVRYLLDAPIGSSFAPAAGESADLAWCSIAEVTARGDRSVVQAVRAALAARRI
jgi:8-oxo-dGTP pyrophosphatase MutT (NUDIX family)